MEDSEERNKMDGTGAQGGVVILPRGFLLSWAPEKGRELMLYPRDFLEQS